MNANMTFCALKMSPCLLMPSVSMAPFHRGEVCMQKLQNVHEHVMTFAPRVIRTFMPDQHRDFFTSQPMLVLAARDANDNMWSTLLIANDGINVGTSPTPDTLTLSAHLVSGDALEGISGTADYPLEVGLLGIELATKRRNRVNGRIIATQTSEATSTMAFKVDQSYGNCPQYISPRQWWYQKPSPHSGEHRQIMTRKLSSSQIQWIQSADTIFIATGYRGDNESDDGTSRGNDSSHRGGPAGFLRVQDTTTLLLPDYSGNNFYNSIGNLLLDSRMGVTIPAFATGGLLQLSGTGRVVLGNEASDLYTGMERLIVFTIQNVNELPVGSIPIRWSNQMEQKRVRVTEIVQESQDVKSFVMEPVDASDTLWTHQAGQYLPIDLESDMGPLVRTYSLSCAPRTTGPSGTPTYRISVKRHALGKASQFLHDHVHVGHVLSVEQPAGTFVLDAIDNSSDPIVLMSVGVGVTPLLAMLQELVAMSLATDAEKRPVYWIHGARNGREHSFRHEMDDLCQRAALPTTAVHVATHVVYSQPGSKDVLGHDFDSVGHLDLTLLQTVLNDDTMKRARYYLCGPPTFVGPLEEGLLQAGVSPRHMSFESF